MQIWYVFKYAAVSPAKTSFKLNAIVVLEVSGLYAVKDNGAWTLRCIVEDVFGSSGAIVLAMIFTLACLTTCVGLITSISQYFAHLFKRFSYRQFVFIIAVNIE